MKTSVPVTQTQLRHNPKTLSKIVELHPVLKYGLAMIWCVPAVVFASWYREAVGGGAFLFGLFVVVISSWYGGYVSGIITTVTYAVLAHYFLLTPQYAFQFTPINLVHTALFTTLGSTISWLQGRNQFNQHQLRSTSSQLAAVLHNITDGITVRTPEGKAVFMNETAVTLMGFPSLERAMVTSLSEAQQNFTITDRYGGPLSWEQLPNARAMQEKASHDLTYQLHTMSTNESRWLNHKASAVLDGEGNVVYVVNIFRDVTTERQRENALRNLNAEILEQNQRYQAVWSNLPGIVWETRAEPDGTYKATFISPYLERMLGYTVDEWLANPNLSIDTLFPEDRETMLQEMMDIVKDKDSDMIEYRSVAKDGRIVHMESYLSILRDENKVPKGIYGVTLDVSTRKQAESDLERQTEELRRSNEELQRFAYVASHDLQEPLRMVTSYLQLIEQRYQANLDQDAKEFIGFAVDGAARMKSLINDLLTYSRVGSQVRPFERFPMQRAVEQAKRNLELSVSESRAKITVGELPEILGDEHQFIQLFQNLLGNAIKFCGTAQPEINIKAERKDRKWLFSVQDNGIGIENEYLNRIFIIFQRLHNREDFEGTGIGLAICKKIVERHGGKIWAESTVGQGATFFFELPVRSTRRLGS